MYFALLDFCMIIVLQGPGQSPAPLPETRQFRQNGREADPRRFRAFALPEGSPEQPGPQRLPYQSSA